MPFHPRYIVLAALGLAGWAALVLAVAVEVPLGPALGGGFIAGAGYPFFLRHAHVPVADRVVGVRAAWLFVVTAGLLGVMLWAGTLLSPWDSALLDGAVFLLLCLACGLISAKACGWAARVFKRIDFEMSLPAAERLHRGS